MITVPGTWIDLPDRQRAHQIVGQFMAIRAALEEASLSLDLFTATRAADTNEPSSRGFDWQRQGRLLRIYARSFMFMADRVLSIARAIGQHSDATEHQRNAASEVASAVPRLHDVRNSSAHVEDRLVFKGPRGATIQPEPLVNGPIHAPGGGVMLIENLIDTRFGGTLADGTHGEIDVVPQTLEGLISAVEKLALTFTWIGPPLGQEL